MALNFPSNPSENDIYQFGLLTYIFKNGKWVSQSRGASQLPWYSNMEQARALWKRLAAEAGLNLVNGSFEEGAEITSSSDVVWWQAGSAIYGWHLNEAKTVPAGSTPATSGGVGSGAWVDRGDVALRSDLNIVVKVFESVADMVADASLVVGQKCRTLGYYAVGDGGANDYEIVAAATGTDDGGSYIDLSGSGYQAKGLFIGGAVNVKWFGAKGDGVTDDTVAVQNAFLIMKNLVTTPRNGTVTAYVGDIYFDAGNYRITNSIILNTCHRLHIVFNTSASIIVDINDNTKDALSLEDAQLCTVDGLKLNVVSPIKNVLSLVQNNSTNTLTPSSNAFKNTYINGAFNAHNGLSIYYTTNDANNDFHNFDGLFIVGYSNSAVYIYGLQSHCNHFSNVNINGANIDYTDNYGKYGFKLESGNGQASPSIIVDSGACGWHSISDVYATGGAVNGITCKNISSENSKKAVVINSSSDGGNTKLILNNYRFASDNIHTDGRCIDVTNGGVVNIDSCEIGVNGTASTIYPTIRMSSDKTINLTVLNTNFKFRQTGTANNSTQVNPIYVSGTYAPLANIKVLNCNFINGAATTQNAYLTITSGTTINAYYGECTLFISYSGVSQIDHINPSYPNQEITLMLTNLNTTLVHGASGNGAILLKSDVNFTPTQAPYAVKLKYNSSFGRWLQI